jgi:hypothetical protein
MRRLITSSILLSSFLIAQNFPTQGNENKKSSIERGWRFGQFQDLNKTKKTKRTEAEILEEILKVQKKQLKVQKKVLAILQKQFDPQPKEIVVNGKKCIANSSAECFDYPITPEAKRIPVMANWLKHPTVENAAKYQAWLSKWMGHVFDVGYSNSFAITQFGDKYYKRHFITPGFVDGFGENADFEQKAEEKVIKALKNEIEIYIFLGENSDTDTISIPELTEFYNKYSKNIDIGIIYPNKQVRDKLLRVFKPIKDKGGKYIKKYNSIAGILEINKNVFYGNDFFKKFTIYATPTILVRLKKQNEAQSVIVGRASVSDIEDRIVNYLKMKKVIPANYISNQKEYMVDSNNNYAKEKLYNKFYYDLNLSRKNLYNNPNLNKREEK